MGDYVTDELAQIKNVFRPTADRYRRHLRMGGHRRLGSVLLYWIRFFTRDSRTALAVFLASIHWVGSTLDCRLMGHRINPIAQMYGL